MRALAVCFFMTFAIGCDEPADRPATWSYIHPAIIVPSCATSSCHSELSEVAGIDFSDEGASLDHMLERQYVLPGDANSALLLHLEGDEAELMPPDAPLPVGDRELIERWVLEGAAP